MAVLNNRNDHLRFLLEAKEQAAVIYSTVHNGNTVTWYPGYHALKTGCSPNIGCWLEGLLLF